MIFAAGNHHNPCDLSAGIEESMCNQIAGNSALVEDALARLLGDAVQSTESSSHLVAIRLIHITVDQSIATAYQLPGFDCAVKQAVHNIMLEHYDLDAIKTRINYFPAFAAPAKMFVKNGVDKCFPKQAKTQYWCETAVKPVL